MLIRLGTDAIRAASLPTRSSSLQSRMKATSKGFEGGELMDDPVAPGEEMVILRRPVLIVDGRLLPQPAQHMVKGQLRTEGIPVEPLMGGDQKDPVPADQFANPLEHSSPLPGGSP